MAMYEERCLHSDVCKYGKNRTNGMYCTGERCLQFKDRTKWAEKKDPVTNAERIRAMSDEELCKFLGEYKFCDICEEGCDSCTYNGDCDKRLLEWLKQPADEERDKGAKD